MHVLRLAAMILAIIGGFTALSNRPAAAVPIGAGAMPLAAASDNPLVEKAGWRHRHHGFHRHHWRPHLHHGFYRHHWRPYRHVGFYRPYRFRPVYGVGWGYRPVAWGPRLVCRWRPSPWGPRQVCWRGW
jgi:hypothetical protein